MYLKLIIMCAWIVLVCYLKCMFVFKWNIFSLLLMPKTWSIGKIPHFDEFYRSLLYAIIPILLLVCFDFKKSWKCLFIVVFGLNLRFISRIRAFKFVCIETTFQMILTIIKRTRHYFLFCNEKYTPYLVREFTKYY